MNTNLRLFWPVILSVLCFSCDRMKYPTPSELFHDYKARAYVTLEMYEDAMSEYLKMIEENPMRFSTHNNFGILLNMVQKPEEAVKSLEHSLALAEHEQDPVKMFTASFNLGVLNGLLKNYEKALMHYQNALNIVPTSIETKTNIELLIQQQQQQQNQNGQGQSNSSDKDNKDGQSGENKNDQNKDPQDKDGKNEEDKDKKDNRQRQSSPKYKPRPFKGEQLSEGDVKKILGELRNQEQKIRANFDKKEKGKPSKNGKDW